MNGRGYAVIGLDRVKDPANLGGVLRAAGCFGAGLVVVGGGRLGRFSTDTMKAWRHVPCIETDDMMASVPFGCIPVAVEMHARARPLESFVHPERAIYIFGPEDGSVQKSIVERVPIVVQINTNRCMNLAAAVNVVLYDRAAKRQSAR